MKLYQKKYAIPTKKQKGFQGDLDHTLHTYYHKHGDNVYTRTSNLGI